MELLFMITIILSVSYVAYKKGIYTDKLMISGVILLLFT